MKHLLAMPRVLYLGGLLAVMAIGGTLLVRFLPRAVFVPLWAAETKSAPAETKLPENAPISIQAKKNPTDENKPLAPNKHSPTTKSSPVPQSQTDQSASIAADSSADLQKRLRQELGEAGVSEEQNPFLSILQQMQETEVLLSRKQTGPRTQRIQKQILAELDRLIAQAQQSGRAKTNVSSKAKPDSTSAGSPQGVSSPDQPKESAPGAPKESTAKSPPGASGEENPAEIQQLRSLWQEVWGLLPERQRQQVIEVPVEEFLPKYKSLIIDYFRRLAEERSRSKGS